ncbi:hypothetical protein GOB81_12615 [Acetobacter sp. LMG 1627]|uniref:Uncharacterized protein n=1 Tax=Acetobacter conturbans TaxID=1737472 RepID=A0ABX0K542_9PROT|nr:hypothetical protein [Acetobacter conturbans]
MGPHTQRVASVIDLPIDGAFGCSSDRWESGLTIILAYRGWSFEGVMGTREKASSFSVI